MLWLVYLQEWIAEEKRRQENVELREIPEASHSVDTADIVRQEGNIHHRHNVIY